MRNFMNQVFGPLGKDSCVYFYFFSVFFYITFILAVIGAILYIVTKYNKLNGMHILNLVFAIVNSFLAYFVNRLLHTMCAKSLI